MHAVPAGMSSWLTRAHSYVLLTFQCREEGFRGDVSVVRYNDVHPHLDAPTALTLAVAELRRCGAG